MTLARSFAWADWAEQCLCHAGTQTRLVQGRCLADLENGCKQQLALTTRSHLVTRLTRCVVTYDLGRCDRCLTITDLMTVVRTGATRSADS
jgi:hypothetical protein